MFREIICYESKKLFIRRSIIILVLLFIFLAFLCWDGIGDYKKIEANKKPFQEMERDKVSRHIHYTAYGTRGIRLLYIPCSLSIIFNDSAVFPGMSAHVDTGESLEISNSFKGKDLFSNSNGFMDYAGIMLLISCFLALIYGWDGTRNPEYLNFISDISGSRKSGFLITLSRIILLNLVFLVLSVLALVWMLINGINAANIFYLVYVMVLTLVITSFVAAGAVIGSFKSKVAQFITMPVLYFLLLLVIPWLIHRAVYMEAKEGIQSIYEFEYQSFKYMIDFEKRFYNRFKVWKSGDVAPDDVKAMIQSGQDIEYKKMREAELNRFDGIFKRILVYQTLASFFPTTFYISTNKELSSKGFQNFIAFYRYSYNMKQDFIKFYIERKFYRPLPKSGVEPFIKGNEDIFYGKCRLPESFLLGLILTVGYIAVLLVVLYRMQSKLINGINDNQIKKPEIDLKKANSILILCKDEQIKSDIFHFYQCQENSVCINKMKVDFHSQFSVISADKILKYLCRLAGVSYQLTIENLSILGIKNLKSLKLSEEEIMIIYAMVKLSKKEYEYVVLNDFFKQRSRQFERSLFKLLVKLEEAGKKILYLSCEMYSPRYQLNGKLDVAYDTFPMKYSEITLR
jgi:hypothetical protein